MRLAITAGGTGGHIYPALAVLEALRGRDGIDLDARFFGPDDRSERDRVAGAALPFSRVPAAPIRGRGLWGLTRSFARLFGGTIMAFAMFLRFRPHVVLSTGGYASFPCSVAARLQRRPLVVYLPDVAPGWAVRAEMRIATVLAASTDRAREHLPASKTEVTGYPVRPAFLNLERADARRKLCLEEGERLVLVAGASQGASAINRVVFESLEALCAEATVVHVTGDSGLLDAQAKRSALPEALRSRYLPASYRDDMPTVMVAADLAVLRAGASTLGELPAASLPSILVPGTFAGGHQRGNAAWLADAGAAVVLEEHELEELPAQVQGLLSDSGQLDSMRARAGGLARPAAAESIADLILEVAKK
jgi:UDP-N-acetylglucosamine--N-acetylmuramyl-(pentapeptide) pyrophosphoryl-undecaprenol N-acetylglucosamine transferase